MIPVELDYYLVNTKKVAKGSRMEGQYVSYLELFVKKHEKQIHINKDKIKHLIILDWYDRAQHKISKKETRNNGIISNNSLLMTLEGIKLDLFANTLLPFYITTTTHF